MLRNFAEMQEPVGVPAKGRCRSVPTRPSGSKSTRTDPLPVGSPGRLQEASVAATRSTSFCARARGNAPRTRGALAVGAVAVGGTKVGGGRTTVTVGAVPVILPALTVGFALGTLAMAVGTSRFGTLVGSSGVGMRFSGSAFATAMRSTTTPPMPTSRKSPIPPRIQGRAEPFAACLPNPAGGGVPRGAPQERQ